MTSSCRMLRIDRQARWRRAWAVVAALGVVASAGLVALAGPANEKRTDECEFGFLSGTFENRLGRKPSEVELRDAVLACKARRATGSESDPCSTNAVGLGLYEASGVWPRIDEIRTAREQCSDMRTFRDGADRCSRPALRMWLKGRNGREPTGAEVTDAVRACNDRQLFRDGSDRCARSVVRVTLEQESGRIPTEQQVDAGVRSCKLVDAAYSELTNSKPAPSMSTGTGNKTNLLDVVERMSSEETGYLEKRNPDWDESPLLPLPSPETEGRVHLEAISPNR